MTKHQEPPFPIALGFTGRRKGSFYFSIKSEIVGCAMERGTHPAIMLLNELGSLADGPSWGQRTLQTAIESPIAGLKVHA